ncbi:MAG: hypothetical protein NVSMB48_17940 [Marmoricola sp.]
MTARRVSLLIVLAVVVAGLASGIVPRLHQSSDPTSGYCRSLTSHQAQLSAILGSGDPTALVDNLGLFQALASDAPSDVAGSWTALNTAIQSLKAAIAASGHRPSEFAGGTFPRGIPAAQRQAIQAAADTLTSSTTVAASSAIDQEVRDVCHLDLGM